MLVVSIRSLNLSKINNVDYRFIDRFPETRMNNIPHCYYCYSG